MEKGNTKSHKAQEASKENESPKMPILGIYPIDLE